MANRGETKNRSRKENIRDEQKTLVQRELLTFSFKYLDQTQPTDTPNTLEDWETLQLLKPFVDRLVELSKLTRDEAVNQKQIKIYGEFPPSGKTDFSHPKFVDSAS